MCVWFVCMYGMYLREASIPPNSKFNFRYNISHRLLVYSIGVYKINDSNLLFIMIHTVIKPSMCVLIASTL